MSDMDYSDILDIKNKQSFASILSYPISENNLCCQNWLGKYPVFFKQ